MTEQQIENLKKVLSSSEQELNSSDLDKKIITASKINAPERRRLFDSWVENYQSLSMISSAALSVLLTVGMLFTLSFILSSNDNINERNNVAVQASIVDQVVVIEQDSSVATAVPNTALQQPSTQQPATQHARDQILASIEPLDIKVILDGMEFSHVDERALAEMAVTEAMADIRFMVMDGQLNSARDRYERLRRSCAVCSLPKTLEALVLNEESSSRRS